ncbi:sensor histidine kinase [Phenylobacterium sp.]|uniref:sensor histidine kinase n=1 Tax=Phenylobacterium sp. TaxID=1871053 RepID=UPI003564B433
MAAQPPTESEDAALSMTMAVVASSPAPLLMLDGTLNIVAASTSFCAAFGIDPATAPGSDVFALGAGEWNIPQLRSLLDATVSDAAKVDSYEMELRRPGCEDRCLVIQAQRFAYLDLEHTWLLVAVSDVTQARADKRSKDEALAQNRVLLQEVRHRVANSLQIIASVLLQNARRTPSEETRTHLRDAHNRVMSVAALERQLSAADDGDEDVPLHAYFTRLCESIASSMIADPDQLSLAVEGGDGVVPARVSVSLGLIVTELVINALKHAFPEGRRGKITVDYEFRGPNWTLCVCDNGVGMPSDPALVHTGLGTSIVQALAKQLQASVEVEPAHPGTKVSIEHTQIALVDDDAKPPRPALVVERPAA